MTAKVENLHLQCWEEVLGKCLDVQVSGTEAVVVLEANNRRCRLRLPGIKQLAKTLQGQTIAVLKTESSESPFVIRKVRDAKKAINSRQRRHSRLQHCEDKKWQGKDFRTDS